MRCKRRELCRRLEPSDRSGGNFCIFRRKYADFFRIKNTSISVIFLSTFKKPLSTPSSAYFLFTIPGFLGGMLWVFVLANEVVGLLTALGFFWKINNVVMGLTFLGNAKFSYKELSVHSILAWANSIGDLVADLGLARIGKAGTAVAACFGSPLLNLLGIVSNLNFRSLVFHLKNLNKF